MKSPQSIWLAATCLLAAALNLNAAPTLDLQRVIPAPADQPTPIQDFLRRPLLDDPTISPSGNHLAFIVADADERSYGAVVELKTNKLQVFHIVDNIGSIRLVSWLNDQRVIGFGLGLYAKDVDRPSEAYPLLRGTNAYLIGIPRKDRTHPLFWVGSAAERGTDDTGPTRIDSGLNLGLGGQMRKAGGAAAETNRRHILHNFPRLEDATGASLYFSDKDGEIAFAIGGKDGIERLYRYSDGKWVLCPVDLDAHYFIGAGNEKDQIVVCPRQRTGKPLPLQFMNAATGELGVVLLQDKVYDASTAKLYRDRQNGIIVGVSYQRSGWHNVWFDDSYKAAQKLLESSFPGLRVQIIDNNEAGNLFLVSTYSDKEPAVYHWADIVNHQAGLVKHSRPWIDPARTLPMSVMKFTTADGRSLDAYVTLPKGASKSQPPPLVVVPPSSPWEHTVWGYDDLVQYLASRGYAVLQPTHRGLHGYNGMFTEEDRYNFIGMSDDIGAATATLVKSGLVDQNRVGILGQNYGGYFAIEGIERQKDLYRCAVTLDGFFDWGTLMTDLKYFQYGSNVYAYLRRKLGDPKIEKQKYHDISPLNFVAQAKAAVFVSHAKADDNVYRVQSQKLVSELERNHLVHDTYFPGEISRAKDRLADKVELYTRIEAFLEKNLKNAK